MSHLEQAIEQLDRLERAARHKSWLHRRDPRAKVIVVVAYVVALLSVGLGRVALYAPYLLLLIAVAKVGRLSLKMVALHSAVVIPFAAMIGLPNFFARDSSVGVWGVSQGLWEWLSIVLRALLSLGGVVVLIASTGIYPLCRALRAMHLPALFVVLILMIVRYVRLLLWQAMQMRRAILSRGFGRRSFPLRLWSLFVGELLLSAVRRSEWIDYAMQARLFRGDISPTLRSGYRHGGGGWQRADSLFVIFTLSLLTVLSLSERVLCDDLISDKGL